MPISIESDPHESDGGLSATGDAFRWPASRASPDQRGDEGESKASHSMARPLRLNTASAAIEASQWVTAPLDSRLIRCFLGVLEHKSVTEAAEALCLTQPAISKNILKLEEELGEALFVRVSNGMVATPYGQVLGRYVRRIREQDRLARTDISELKREAIGTLRVGAGPMWSMRLLPEAIATFHRMHPGVIIRMRSGVIDTLLPGLIKGKFDLICAALDFPDHPDVDKHMLLDVEFVVIASREHTLAAQPTSDLGQLLQFPWVGFADDAAANARLTRFFSVNGMPRPEFATEASSLSEMLSLIRSGDYLSAVSSVMLPHADMLGVVPVRVTGAHWKVKAGAACMRKATNPLVEQFLSHIRRSVTAHLEGSHSV